ncbi:hypothetical protein [Hahella ganghwensis]|uniref:hypothetical protein n=1 Tax=Hahella ganghwensis TaxID=286420 RepID=UPI000379210F|nr:hypothetical protein [Hahella ganghwensis]
MLSWPFFRRGKKGLVGIEVRANGLAIAVAEPTANGNRINRLDFIEAKAAQRSTALKDYVNTQKIEGMSCNLVLPPELYGWQQIERPPVEEDELAEAVRWKIKDTLDYPIEEAVIDVFDFPADALRGKPLQVNVISARRTLIRELIAMVNSCGLILKSIDITELALRNLVLGVQQEGKSVALMVMQEHRGLMLLIKDGSVYLSRRIDADMEGFDDPDTSARVGQQLALEIQRSMDYFESQLGQTPPRSIIASSIMHEAELLSRLDETLGLEINTLPEDQLGIADDQFASAQHWIACGAALRKQVSG